MCRFSRVSAAVPGSRDGVACGVSFLLFVLAFVVGVGWLAVALLACCDHSWDHLLFLRWCGGVVVSGCVVWWSGGVV